MTCYSLEVVNFIASFQVVAFYKSILEEFYMRHYLSVFLICILSFGLFQSSLAQSVTKVNPVSESQAATFVNLNSADLKALMTIHGIGEKKGQAIITYRQQHGPFKSVDDLTNVKGFSKNAIAKLEKNNPGKLVVK